MSHTGFYCLFTLAEFQSVPGNNTLIGCVCGRALAFAHVLMSLPLTWLMSGVMITLLRNPVDVQKPLGPVNGRHA